MSISNCFSSDRIIYMIFKPTDDYVIIKGHAIILSTFVKFIQFQLLGNVFGLYFSFWDYVHISYPQELAVTSVCSWKR